MRALRYSTATVLLRSIRENIKHRPRLGAVLLLVVTNFFMFVHSAGAGAGGGEQDYCFTRANVLYVAIQYRDKYGDKPSTLGAVMWHFQEKLEESSQSEANWLRGVIKEMVDTSFSPILRTSSPQKAVNFFMEQCCVMVGGC